jgi:hypothetical protein
MTNTTDKSTNRLPNSLAIALWLVGTLWLIAFVVYLFDVDRDVIYATLAFGLVAYGIEWMALRKS